MTEAYTIANDALRDRAEAAELAEKELREAAASWRGYYERTFGELTEAKRRIESLEDTSKYRAAVADLRMRAEAAENERDALRAQIQTGDYLLRPAPPTISEVMLQGALQRAEVAEKEREEWERSHDEVAEVIGAIAGALKVTRGGSDSFEDWTGRITAALGELRTQLEAVTAERDELNDQLEVERKNCDTAHAIAARWIDRAAQLDAQTASAKPHPAPRTDLEMQTGPVAFERNQLRDEVAELRSQVDDLRTKLAAAESRATMHERDADEAGRAVNVLSTIIRASVEAIARGVK